MCVCADGSISLKWISSEAVVWRCSATQVFSCAFCKISKNTFYYRTPLVAASLNYSLSQSIYHWREKATAESSGMRLPDFLHIYVHWVWVIKLIIKNVNIKILCININIKHKNSVSVHIHNVWHFNIPKILSFTTFNSSSLLLNCRIRYVRAKIYRHI